ncbi:hypothetical protein [Flavobacterium suncheonense]|uniref:Uncharacterized protein n=1 Tax=Flavobacterium suncheonense GH29-5 = DSM 17707 TaxID=1121899 RepID=A0A0A2MHV9_9FLAO|nr:hypothetical protein [Flavobacterium suncheonense]KGO87905.1 hypothetical protein Q764_12205 [Flavobacterium suncheonense GH29-5 = DSM 17707]
MRRLIREELVRKGVRSIFDEGEIYYFVTDIREKMPECKIDSDKIVRIPGGELVVEAQYVTYLTDFDKNRR